MKKKLSKNQAGFTLLELLIAVSLMAITAGVTGDIILSIVRSYNKTKITNEVEQAGNIAMAKLEKELRTATLVTSPNPPENKCVQSITFQRRRVDDNQVVDVTYTISNGSLLRSENDGTTTIGPSPIIDPTQADGVRLENDSQFCILDQVSPFVMQIYLNLAQADASASNSFIGSIKIDQTIVLRGTY